MSLASPLIVALDQDTPAEALALIDRLGAEADFYKLGSVLYLEAGREIQSRLRERNKKIFLDLKYHDIPNTVEQACLRAARSGVTLLTIHLCGGREMIRSAVRGARAGNPDCRVIGVSLLTSHSPEELPTDLLVERKPVDYVRALVKNGLEAGIDGIVCSPLETADLRAEFGKDFLIVNPGIRPAGSAKGDQKRTLGPKEALAAGASHLVVGRPIYADPDPVAAFRRIRDEIA